MCNFKKFFKHAAGMVVFFVIGIHAYDITKDAANTGFHFLEVPLNPHLIAMGNAGTAQAGKGFSYYNPALPFLLKKSYLAAEYGQHPKADFQHPQLEGVLFLERWFFGLSFNNASIENIYETNFWGNLPYYDASFSQQFINMSLNVGFSQWSDFAFALCLNGTQDRIHEEYAYAFSFSAGAVYVPIPERLTLGISILYLGTSTPMLGDDSKSAWGKGESLPVNSRLGVAWTDSLREMPYTVAFDIVYRNVRDKSDEFTKHIRDRFTFPLGAEVWVLPPLAIRLGKRINMPTEVINFGVGLKFDPLAVDASFTVPKFVDDAEIKWRTGITYYLKSKKTKKPKETVTIKKPLIITPLDTVPDSASKKIAVTPDTGKQTSIQEIDTTVADSIVSDTIESSLIPIDSAASDSGQTIIIPDSSEDEVISQSKPPITEEAVDRKDPPEPSIDSTETIAPPAENKPVEVPVQDTTQNQ